VDLCEPQKNTGFERNSERRYFEKKCFDEFFLLNQNWEAITHQKPEYLFFFLVQTWTHQDINTSTHQHVNTSTHQDINTSTHQHMNTSRHQHINTSTHQHIHTSTHRHIINTSTNLSIGWTDHFGVRVVWWGVWGVCACDIKNVNSQRDAWF